MTPLFVTFKTSKANPNYKGQPYESRNINGPEYLEYIGTGMLIQISRPSLKLDGISAPGYNAICTVVDLLTGELLTITSNEIKVPVRDGKMIGPESPTNPIGISLGNNGTGNGIKG